MVEKEMIAALTTLMNADFYQKHKKELHTLLYAIQIEVYEEANAEIKD